jgi:large subunit ribosomal protein L15
VGFEGGQMPIQRRLPKRGFVSLTRADTANVRVGDLMALDAKVIDLLTLKAANVVPIQTKTVKVYLSGEVTKAVSVQGLLLTKGARAAIEAAGGKIVE